MRPLARTIVLSLVAVLGLRAQTPFSQDSAAAFLRTISVEIGPRPMGSPNERRAMEFGLKKFREFGLQEAYIMEMAVAGVGATATNTHSGAAVGVLKGETDRIILIGGHIDSAGPDIPGANDDGSGSATVIELARVLAHTKHKSTIVFCLFGGEESGLRGSKFFASNFRDTSKIALMLQVDMDNGADWLLPMFETHTTSAPEWLVGAAFEEFNKLPYSGLYYPTHFYTFNYAFAGVGAGSDHEPFLDMGIPAIDFTSDPNEPIHVPEDNYANFNPAGLKRSGDLVYKLVDRFDAGVPEEKRGSFFTVQLGRTPFFIPSAVLKLVIVLAFLLAGAALMQTRKQRTEVDRKSPEWKQIPALKLFLLALIVQTCVWLSENVVGFSKGVRYPWYADFSGYFVLAFFAALIGIWLSLQLVPRLDLSRDPHRYFLRAVLFLTAFIILLGLTTVRMAFYPAVALLLLSCAMLVRNPLLKFLLWIASPHLLYRLVFGEAFGLFSRGFVETPATFTAALFTTLIFILFFALWSFPFLLGFAALYFDAKADLLWLKKYRGTVGIAGSGILFLTCAVYLDQLPTFSQYWKQRIHLEQNIDADAGRLRVVLKSGEYLNGTTVRAEGRDTTIASHTNEVVLHEMGSVAQDWLTEERSVTTEPRDTTKQVDCNLTLHTKYRPYQLSVSYSSGKGKFLSVASPFAVQQTGSLAILKWYSFPDTSLFIPVRIVTSGVDSLVVSIEATFVEKFEDVSVEKEMATTQYRTIIHKRTTFKP